MIPHSKPTITPDDCENVLRVLTSGNLVQGTEVEAFENEFSSFIGVKGGVAVSSGTAALHLALLSLGVKEGDEVMIPDFVCTAPLNAIHYIGASPIIIDINQDTFNINVTEVKKQLTRRTKAIIVPHMFGLPADMEELLSLGIPIIEDCAHSPGSSYKSLRVGSLGELSVFSFYATKMIATGEGGMILSNNEKLLEKMRDLRDYDQKDFYTIRYNYKMTDFQAALGIGQLKKLPIFIERRKQIAHTFSREFKGCNFELPTTPSDRTHVFYRFVIKVKNASLFIDHMRESGVSCKKPVYRPLHTYLRLSGYDTTKKVWNEAVSLPIYPTLTDADIATIIAGAQSFQIQR